MKLLLIYNPESGGKRAAKILPEVKSYFEEKKIYVEVLITEYSWHGIELVKNANLAKYEGVIAAGGDGTLFETVNGYYQNSGANKPPLGLLPIGTGNAFGKELGLTSYQWQKAIDIISENKPKKIDSVRLTTEGKTYHYLNIMGIGFVADVGVSVEKIKSLGELSYLLGVLYQIAFLKSFKMILIMDGKTVQRDGIFVEIANTRYTGSTFIMAPDAKIDDGYLDIILANKASRGRIIKLLPTIFKGEHVLDEKVEVFKAKKIRIETDIPKVLIPDGELFGSTPIDVECLHKDVEFFWI
ncbi:MAG: diacylglycerol kinase family lipid kinase [Calditrichaeota bacterium]|nr:MAG: diacylglycerol kinase family lipid kinase [Calditrichota bacterium]MBL1206223.1 diacylglycerol kinase family lipid kinase [Calditrichota bacterium]NOG46049.1 diacylglycerol kinase family lipid kinase [Calditrichota bacterium]